MDIDIILDPDCTPAQAAETDLKEYLLERAEAELRATRARIEELQRELARIR